MNPGKFDEQPMPETINRSFGCTPHFPAPCCTAFKTPKSPQPGHQSGSTGPLYVSSGSSITVAICRFPPALFSGFKRVCRAGADANLHFAALFARDSFGQIYIPDLFALAVAGLAHNFDGAQLLAGVRAQVVIG